MNRVPLRYAAFLNRQVLPETTNPDHTFRYVDISAVESTGRVALPEELMTFGAAPSRARRLAPAGATAISTVRTYLRAIAVVPESTAPLVLSTGFAVAEAASGYDPHFLYYACRSDPFVDEVVARSVGVSYPAINPSDLAAIQIPSPAIEVQRRIADFLDDQVARIDNIIAARAVQIGLIEQLPWQHFAEEVNGAFRKRVPLRRALSFISDGPFGSAFGSADYVEQGPAVIRLGNIGFAEFRANDLARIPADVYDRFPRCHIEVGDLLIASLGDARNHAGRACVAPESLGPAMVKGKCFRARVNPYRAQPKFLARLLSSALGTESLERLGRGSTRTMLNIDVLMSAEVPLPALEDQVAMMVDFDRRLTESASASHLVRESLERLGELRASLITAAVSGEFKIASADGSQVPV